MFSWCTDPSTFSGNLIGALLLTGLVSGVTHCAGMCGPLLVGLLMPKRMEKTGIFRINWGLLVGYQIGRALAYTFLGALAAAAGIALSMPQALEGVRAVFLGLAALVFLSAAWPDRMPAFWRRVNQGVQELWGNNLLKNISNFSSSGSRIHPLGIGFLLGFLPCPMIWSALLVAAASGSIIWGAAGMLAFAVGTWPGLTLAGGAGGWLAGRFPAFSSRFRTWLLALNGASLLALAGRTLVKLP